MGFHFLSLSFLQNVDGLEQQAGVPPDYVVEAHGSIRTAACLACGDSADMPKVGDFQSK